MQHLKWQQYCSPEVAKGNFTKTKTRPSFSTVVSHDIVLCLLIERQFEKQSVFKIFLKRFSCRDCLPLLLLLFLFSNDENLKIFSYLRQLILLVPWEAATENCPPGSRHHTSWVKVRNLIIVSSGVWWSRAIYVVIWEAETGCVQGDLLLIHSCNKFLSSSIMEWKELYTGFQLCHLKVG